MLLKCIEGGFLGGGNLILSLKLEVKVDFVVGKGWFLENLISGFREDIFGVFVGFFVEFDVGYSRGIGMDVIGLEKCNF